jgi:c-di-GMP-binding flagellar brake protein YcgR
MMSDRRRLAEDRRGASRTPAVFAVKKSFAGRVSLCQAEDIGPSGMTIRSPRGTNVPAHAEVTLAFALPGHPEEIAAKGVVINDGASGSFRRTGVRFIALRPEHERLIAGYCRTAPRGRATR